MKKSTKNNLLTIVSFYLICLVLGGLLGFSLVRYFGDTLQWWQLILRIVEGVVLFLLAFFFQVIFHEAGHMVAALLRGWSFISFMILGVIISRKEGKFHFSRFSIPGAGGQCLMMPPVKGDTDWGVAFYNAGGILMNMVISLLALLLCVCFHDYLLWDVNVFLFSLFFTGLFAALINGIPAIRGGLSNDGRNIRELKKDKFSTDVFLTSMRMIGYMQQGKSLDEVADTYFTDKAQIDYANPIHEVAVSYDLSLAMAKLDFDKAHVLMGEIEQNLYRLLPIYQKEIAFERVFLYLVSPREGVDVMSLMDAETLKYFDMQARFRPTALRVKYALARLYEHDEVKAEGLYHQFGDVCKSYHSPGEVATEMKLVEYVRDLGISSK